MGCLLRGVGGEEVVGCSPGEWVGIDTEGGEGVTRGPFGVGRSKERAHLSLTLSLFLTLPSLLCLLFVCPPLSFSPSLSLPLSFLCLHSLLLLSFSLLFVSFSCLFLACLCIPSLSLSRSLSLTQSRTNLVADVDECDPATTGYPFCGPNTVCLNAEPGFVCICIEYHVEESPGDASDPDVGCIRECLRELNCTYPNGKCLRRRRTPRAGCWGRMLEVASCRVGGTVRVLAYLGLTCYGSTCDWWHAAGGMLGVHIHVSVDMLGWHAEW